MACSASETQNIGFWRGHSLISGDRIEHLESFAPFLLLLRLLGAVLNYELYQLDGDDALTAAFTPQTTHGDDGQPTGAARRWLLGYFCWPRYNTLLPRTWSSGGGWLCGNVVPAFWHLKLIHHSEEHLFYFGAGDLNLGSLPPHHFTFVISWQNKMRF